MTLFDSLRGFLIDRAVPPLMLAALPLGPIAAAILARDARYLRSYRESLRRCFEHVRAQARARIGSRALEPRAGGQQRQHDRIEGACTHCGQCCLFKQCIFLEIDAAGRSSCRIYGTPFWKLLRCGSYPERPVDIVFYECPGFRTVPVNAPPLARQVIPLVPVRPAAGRADDLRADGPARD